MPRPRIMHELNQAVTCDLLANGATLDFVAQFLGCTKATIQREARRNPKFREAIQNSELEGALKVIEEFMESSRGNWRASKWFLEQRFPKRFARR